MASLSLGLSCKFYLTAVRMILQIRGLGTYDRALSPSLRMVVTINLKAANGKGIGWVVIYYSRWKVLCLKHKLKENFAQILHGEYFYLFIFFLHTLKRTV